MSSAPTPAAPSSAITSAPGSPQKTNFTSQERSRAAQATADAQFLSTLGASTSEFKDALEAAASSVKAGHAESIQSAKTAMKAHESLLPQIDAQVSQLVALAQPQATQWHAAISSQALARTDDTQAEVDQRVERIVALLERREKAKLAFRLAMQAKVDAFSKAVDKERAQLQTKLDKSFVQAKAQYKRSAEAEARTAAARALTAVQYAL